MQSLKTFRTMNIFQGINVHVLLSCSYVLYQARYFTERQEAIASMPPGHCLGAL